jgi:hypothetical protein
MPYWLFFFFLHLAIWRCPRDQWVRSSSCLGSIHHCCKIHSIQPESDCRHDWLTTLDEIDLSHRAAPLARFDPPWIVHWAPFIFSHVTLTPCFPKDSTIDGSIPVPLFLWSKCIKLLGVLRAR